MAITNALEADEDEAALSVGNGGVSVAKAGWVGEGGWDVWGRDDMDGAGRWEGGDVSLVVPFSFLPRDSSGRNESNLVASRAHLLPLFPRPTLQFTQKSHIDSLRLSTEPSVTGPPAWSTDYLIDILPSLSISNSAGSSSSNSNDLPTSLVGDNS